MRAVIIGFAIAFLSFNAMAESDRINVDIKSAAAQKLPWRSMMLTEKRFTVITASAPLQ